MPVKIVLILISHQILSGINDAHARFLTQIINHLLRPGQFPPFPDIIRQLGGINVFLIGGDHENKLYASGFQISFGAQDIVLYHIQLFLGVQVRSLIILNTSLICKK